jgi:hypothetical protein
MNGFWNALCEALGQVQGMSLLAPTPQPPSARSSARRASSSTPSPNALR